MKSEETVAIEFARHLRHMVADAGADGPEAYLLRINPKVTAWFIADGARELHALEDETGRYFHFEGSDGLPLDHFAVTMEGTRAEIEEHAVPFRAGEEVHVNLVEPHMYNEDDAVAKVDGYLIDVVNGVAFVGEKKLVRIEEAGRTIATAVLVGKDAELAEEAARERAEAREKARTQARRSAAAKKGAAKRRSRVQEDATETLADETPPQAGTAPGSTVDEEPPKRSRRRKRAEEPEPAAEETPARRRRRSGRPGRGRAAATRRQKPAPKRRARRKAAEPEAEAAVEARDAVAEEPRAAAPKRRGRARAAEEPRRGEAGAEGARRARARRPSPPPRSAAPQAPRPQPHAHRRADRRGGRARRATPWPRSRRRPRGPRPAPQGRGARARGDARGGRRRGGRRRRRAILSPSAPRPQRWTAPFAREGAGRREVTD